MKKLMVQPLNHKFSLAACGLAVVASMALTGCQGNYSGQVLPSPWYRQDDVQYFAPGPEFKLAREAAALEDARRKSRAFPRTASRRHWRRLLPGASGEHV